MPTDYDREFMEEELMRRLQAGEESALEVIFRKHSNTLLVVAQGLVPYAVAQDLVSEAFWKCWKVREQFVSEAALYQWLKVTVRHGALDHLRMERRTEAREAVVAGELGTAEEASLFRSEVEAALFQRIVREIEALPMQQRTIITLHFIQGLDNTTIADQLRLSVQTVKNQKVRALKVLRRSFRPEDLLLILAVFMGPLEKIIK